MTIGELIQEQHREDVPCNAPSHPHDRGYLTDRLTRLRVEPCEWRRVYGSERQPYEIEL